MTNPFAAGSPEVTAVLVAGRLAWAAQCFREFRNLEDRVRDRIEAQQAALARQSGRHIATVLRAALAPLITTYFKETPTELPPPLSADDLRYVAMDMDGNADLAPLIFRRSVTQPVVGRVAEQLVSEVGTLSSYFALTPEMVDAAFQIGAFPTQFETGSRDGRYLAARYLAQCAGLIAWAATVWASLANVVDPLVPTALTVVVAVHGFALEVSRRRLEQSIRRRVSLGEFVEE